MRFSEIPTGHLAMSEYNSKSIVYRGNCYGMFVNGPCKGDSEPISYFSDNYEDLGELKVEAKEIRKYKVNVSVE